MVTKGNDFGLNENNYDLAKLFFCVLTMAAGQRRIHCEVLYLCGI